jgi:putative cell wall-binding protein
MLRLVPRSLRAAAAVAVTGMVAALTVGVGVAASAAPAAPAAPPPSPVTIYDSIPEEMPPSWVSLGYQATSTSEFGDLIQLDGTDRALTGITVGMVDWACGSDYTKDGDTWVAGPGGPCVTEPGASFTHPITVSFYDADASGAVPVVGKLITSVTQDVTVPFRPSADAEHCGDNRWYNASTASCHNGYAFTTHFDVPGAYVLGESVLVTVSYNTQTHGHSPLGIGGPYNSLNVAVADDGPTVGTDPDANQMFLDSTWAGAYGDNGAGGTGTLRADDGWDPYKGLVIALTADNDLLTAPSTHVAVRQKDVKPTENETTYTSWHEGKNNATPAYAVHPNGLTLGDGSASTIIKGTVVPAAEVTQSQLRALLATASMKVESGSVTFQVPVHFGDAWTDNFTTLRSTSLSAGTFTPALTQTWATTRNWGPYQTADQETNTLDTFLTQLFASYAHVWLAGFGVQADTTARISQFAWDDTIYDFVQPEIEACAEVDDVTVTNLSASAWDFDRDTRAHGSYEFVDGALHLVTTVGDSLAKSAGYLAVDFPLADAGELDMDMDDNLHAPLPPTGSPKLPGLNLGIDITGDGEAEGYLVYEPLYYGDDLWASSTLAALHTSDWPTNGGGGGTYNGTLNQWLIALPDAQVVEVGYSLGSGVIGDVDLHSFTAGCTKYSFDYAVEATTTTGAPVPTTQVFGTATPATVSVTVKTTSNKNGIGTVVLKDGATTIAGPTTLSGTGTATLTVPASLAVGAHSLKVVFTPATGVGQAASTSSTTAFTVTEKGPDVDRLAGLDRYETAVAISQQFDPGVSRVYIAVGTNYADALSAAPVAAKFGAPLLLVKPGDLPGVIKTELERLHPAQIIIVGGEGAISKKVENKLKALTFHPTVKRIAGADRYETSRLVAKSGYPTADTVYFANGANFPDALAAGPAAAHFHGPVILVKGGSFQMERATRLLIAQMGVDEVRIAGGTAVVSAGIESQLKALKYDVLRTAGADRYATAVAINAAEFTTTDRVYVATGGGFADALTGAAIAGYDHAPLFLSNATCMQADVKAAILALDPDEIRLLGGEGVLSADVKDLVTC